MNSVIFSIAVDDKVQNGAHANTDKELTSKEQATMSTSEKYEAKKSILILFGIFLTSVIAMSYIYLMFPELDE